MSEITYNRQNISEVFEDTRNISGIINYTIEGKLITLF